MIKRLHGFACKDAYCKKPTRVKFVYTYKHVYIGDEKVIGFCFFLY